MERELEVEVEARRFADGRDVQKLDPAMRAALIKQGWLPPEEGAAIADALKCLANGDYRGVPRLGGAVGSAVSDLAEALHRRMGNVLRQTVLLSQRLNESVVDAVGATRIVHEVTASTEEISTASGRLVAAADAIAGSTTSLADEANVVRTSADRSYEAAQRAIKSMGDVSDAMAEAAGRVDKLSEASEEISKIVELIEQIAFNTDMLALNASIEAARAGEAGKGFAVVAEEVKRLADQTKRATYDISGRINTLRDDMGTIVRSMHSVSSVVDEGSVSIRECGSQVRGIIGKTDSVSERVREVNDHLTRQREAAGTVAHAIAAAAGKLEDGKASIDRCMDGLDEATETLGAQVDELSAQGIENAVIHRAKSDHAMWKKKLGWMLLGRLQLQDQEIDHHSCRLGKWYDTVQDIEMLRNPAFRGLLEPHVKVHDHARRAIRFFNDGDVDSAAREMQAMREASDRVIELLNQLAE